MSDPDHPIELSECDDLLFGVGEAIRLTREYIGEQALPPIEGWSWFDAYCAIAARLNHDGMHMNIGKWVDDYQREEWKRENQARYGPDWMPDYGV